MTREEFEALIRTNIPFAEEIHNTDDHVGWLAAEYTPARPRLHISAYYYPPTDPMIAIAEAHLHHVGEFFWATFRVGRNRYGAGGTPPDFSSSDDPVRDTLAWVEMIARTTSETNNDH